MKTFLEPAAHPGASPTRKSPQTTLELQDQPARVQEAYQVLQYNQQLVQFADSKAGTLILVNSLFIAAAQAAQRSPGPLQHWLEVICVLLSSLAVLHCMSVVMSRGDFESPGRRDLVFFADILTRERGRYAKEFQAVPDSQHLEGVLNRSYVVASIASRKFNRYVTAQALTAGSALAWVAANGLALV